MATVLCQTCGNRGSMPAGIATVPDWCTCPRGGRRGPGPFVAPPGVVVRYTFESSADAALREQCRLAGNAVHAARDAVATARYGGRESARPNTHPRVRRARKAYLAALRALEALQAQCPHPSRSPYSRVHCDVCYEHVECDVAHFRHLAREVGKRAAMRLAV
jgi:hypothetical protein